MKRVMIGFLMLFLVVGVFSFAGASLVKESNLVSHYDFSDSNDLGKDRTGNFPLSVEGVVTQGSSLLQYTFNDSVSFGTNENNSLKHESFSFGDSYSITFSFNPSGYGDGLKNKAFLNWVNTQTGTHFALFRPPQGGIYVMHESNEGSFYVGSNDFGFDTGIWYSMAITYNSSNGNLRLYQNGVLINSSLDVPKLEGNGLFFMGKAYDMPSTVAFRDFRVYNTALTGEDVSVIHSSIRDSFNEVEDPVEVGTYDCEYWDEGYLVSTGGSEKILLYYANHNETLKYSQFLKDSANSDRSNFAWMFDEDGEIKEGDNKFLCYGDSWYSLSSHSVLNSNVVSVGEIKGSWILGADEEWEIYSPQDPSEDLEYNCSFVFEGNLLGYALNGQTMIYTEYTRTQIGWGKDEQGNSKQGDTAFLCFDNKWYSADRGDNELVRNSPTELVYLDIGTIKGSWILEADEEWGIYSPLITSSEGCPLPSNNVRNVPFGSRVVNNSDTLYCDYDGSFKPAKELGGPCSNDFECDSNTCLSGECYDLRGNVEGQTEELERQGGMIKSIWCKLKVFFQIENDFDSCMASGMDHEICDGYDNDGDGEIDEDFNIGESCSVGVGGCRAQGVYICNATTLDSQCSAVAGTPSAVENCGNDIDDNCNGVNDSEEPSCVCELGSSKFNNRFIGLGNNVWEDDINAGYDCRFVDGTLSGVGDIRFSYYIQDDESEFKVIRQENTGASNNENSNCMIIYNTSSNDYACGCQYNSDGIPASLTGNEMGVDLARALYPCSASIRGELESKINWPSGVSECSLRSDELNEKFVDLGSGDVWGESDEVIYDCSFEDVDGGFEYYYLLDVNSFLIVNISSNFGYSGFFDSSGGYQMSVCSRADNFGVGCDDTMLAVFESKIV